ncbi:MAG: glycoside hydrolase family 2 protein, partial [Chloroflexota bacterium]|nr:glycoside hydrolase family 2 protein [Chloroflexota bacterium]
MLVSNLNDGVWRMSALGEEDWVPTTLPGEVHVALMAAGRIPDPFIADNELQVMWVAETDWEFAGTIEVSEALLAEDRVELQFDGLDTLTDVYLNGECLGKTDNAFRSYAWEVKDLLNEGENQIWIVFHSPVNYVKQLQEKNPLPSPEQSIQGGPYLRKAPCQWGWDWGPMLPPIGIWKDARLVGYSKARLGPVHLQQDHHFGGEVTVTAEAEIEKWADPPLQLCMTMVDPDGKTFATTCKVLNGTAAASIELPEPQLWWPNGYGDQPLYQVRVSLRTEDEDLLDQQTFQLGLRALELVQREDKYGESFTFVINGVPVFAKGANWIPADSFPTRITREMLEGRLSDAAEAHHNMIRVWGGGLYESEDFYDLCDQAGILVWQDFLFSCSIYPLGDEAFVENIRQEVVDNVQRLRHRASLALWCGNNEMDWGWEAWGWNMEELEPYREAYKAFFYETLPAWLNELDPETAYWFSSPSSGTPFENANYNERGDAHYWEVWHGSKPFTAYREQYPRFMSEFGFQSLAPLKTIQAFADESHWNLTDYIIEHHQRNPWASALFMGQMALYYRMPVDFPSLVYMTMVLQSEGIRYGVEHWRRNRHRVSGTLYWQLNDCWPVASWSSIDYFGRWKALHYASRKFYAPLLLSIEDDEQTAQMKVHLTSDLQTTWTGEVHWRLMRLDGGVLEGGQVEATVEPFSSVMLFEKDFGHLTLPEKRETVFVAQLIHDGEVLATQVATFVRNKHVQYTDPQLKAYLLEGQGDTATIEIVASSLARFVELTLDDADVIFSDNYFDVLPGET